MATRNRKSREQIDADVKAVQALLAKDKHLKPLEACQRVGLHYSTYVFRTDPVARQKNVEAQRAYIERKRQGLPTERRKKADIKADTDGGEPAWPREPKPPRDRPLPKGEPPLPTRTVPLAQLAPGNKANDLAVANAATVDRMVEAAQQHKGAQFLAPEQHEMRAKKRLDRILETGQELVRVHASNLAVVTSILYGDPVEYITIKLKTGREIEWGRKS